MIMKHYIILFIILFTIVLKTSAQGLKSVSPEKSKAVIEMVNNAAAKINTLHCSFVQTKSLQMLNDKFSSEGEMYYKKSNMLRWEYKKPYTYLFVLNADNVLMQSSTTKNNISVAQNKVFQQIANIMVSSVTGKCLSDGSSFESTILQAKDGQYVASLKPLRKEMKQMFANIYLYFNRQQNMVEKVVMTEANGDSTVIELKVVSINKSIDEKLFSVH